MAVAMEIRQVDGVDSHLLEHADELGYPLDFLVHGRDRHSHVPVTGERNVPRQRGEAILLDREGVYPDFDPRAESLNELPRLLGL